jgi:hypothetical protein
MNECSLYVLDGAAIIPKRMALSEILAHDRQHWIGGMEDAAVSIGHASYVQNLIDNEFSLGEVSNITSCSETLSASGMAVEALLKLMRSELWQRPVNIVYTHGSIDEDIASSPACRLQLLADAPQSVPLSVSQQEETSGFAALWLSSAYLARARPEAVTLLVGAEKWTHPQVRWHPPHPPFGDGACALLLGSRRPAAGVPCIRIWNIEMRQLWSGVARSYGTEHIRRITEALRAFTTEIGASAAALIAPPLQPGVCEAVSQVLAISHLPELPDLQGINLATAHPLADIALRIGKSMPVCSAVSWNVTPGGHFAAMLVEQLP